MSSLELLAREDHTLIRRLYYVVENRLSILELFSRDDRTLQGQSTYFQGVVVWRYLSLLEKQPREDLSQHQ